METRRTPLLRIAVRRAGDLAVLHLDGELDYATAPHLEDTLRDLLGADDRPARLVVDVAALGFMDVAGLNPLIAAARRLGGRQAVRLRGGRHPVVRLIPLLGLGELFGLDG